MPQVIEVCLANCLAYSDCIAIRKWLEVTIGTKNYDYKWNNTTGMVLLLRKHNSGVVTELLLKFG